VFSFRVASRVLVLAAGFFSLAAAVAQAQDALSPERFAIGASVGSDGVGGDLQYELNRFVTLRGRGTWLDFSYVGNASQLRYKAKVDLTEGGGFVDLHPFANPFTLSVGAVAGPRKANLSAFYRQAVLIDHVPVPAAALGTVGGQATLSSPAPFVGLGFDNTFTQRSHWGFKLIAGVAFSHAPDVSLAPTSGLAQQNPAIVEPAILQVEHDIREDGRVLQYFPQVSAGVTYRF
jgi:hypothetical protein